MPEAKLLAQEEASASQVAKLKAKNEIECTVSQQNQRSSGSCNTCGSTHHIANQPKCPGKNHICRKCKKKEHFASVCKQTASQAKLAVRKV